MRGIKFRMWSKEYKQMFDFDTLKYASEGMVKCANETLERRGINRNKDVPWGLFLPLGDDDAIFEQFTGLKDKNGVEIYEGDIVTATWYDYEEPSHDATGEVIFNNGWHSFCIWDEEDKTMSEMNGQGHYLWEIEVIGNIHNNPEVSP